MSATMTDEELRDALLHGKEVRVSMSKEGIFLSTEIRSGEITAAQASVVWRHLWGPPASDAPMMAKHQSTTDGESK